MARSWTFLRRAFLALRRHVYSSFILTDSGPGGIPVVPPLPPEDRAQLLSPADVPALLALRPGLARATVEARLEAGHDCLCVWLNDELASTVWFRYDCMWLPELRRLIDLPEGTAYAYDSFTNPAYRRQGLVKRRAPGAARYLREAGYTNLVGYVRAENLAGLAAARSVGAAFVGRIRWFHLGPLGVELATTPEKRSLSLRIRDRAHELPSGTESVSGPVRNGR